MLVCEPVASVNGMFAALAARADGVPHGLLLPGPLVRREDRPDAGRIDRDRLFREDVFAGRDRRFEMLRPEPGRRGEDHQVRRVRGNGEIRWKGEFILIGEALVDELIGIAELETGDHVVRFCDMDIGLINRRGLFIRFAPPREGLRDPAEQTAQPNLSGIMPV